MQGFRRMAARNKPAGIRSLVYGMIKGKVRIEGLSVSTCLYWDGSLDQTECNGFLVTYLRLHL
jgi:hypothetical protein